jgi:hypothetical protein
MLRRSRSCVWSFTPGAPSSAAWTRCFSIAMDELANPLLNGARPRWKWLLRLQRDVYRRTALATTDGDATDYAGSAVSNCLDFKHRLGRV